MYLFRPILLSPRYRLYIVRVRRPNPAENIRLSYTTLVRRPWSALLSKLNFKDGVSKGRVGSLYFIPSHTAQQCHLDCLSSP